VCRLLIRQTATGSVVSLNYCRSSVAMRLHLCKRKRFSKLFLRLKSLRVTNCHRSIFCGYDTSPLNNAKNLSYHEIDAHLSVV